MGIIFQARISAHGLPVYGETAWISFVVSSCKFWNFGRDNFSNTLRGYLEFTFFCLQGSISPKDFSRTFGD
jgi:hypothetical protein